MARLVGRVLSTEPHTYIVDFVFTYFNLMVLLCWKMFRLFDNYENVTGLKYNMLYLKQKCENCTQIQNTNTHKNMYNNSTSA